MYKQIKRIHLIGVGGIGMSGLAELLISNGYSLSGSDLQRNDSIRRLEGLGAQFLVGHDAHHVDGSELVVFSSAIRSDNPERVAATEKGILSITRAEMLAEMMRLKHGIAVAGAHGKTTTTSLIALALIDGGLDPTVVVGGRLDNFGGTNARLGRGNFMVVEADESDGSFNRFTPCISVTTNVDREHMDHYKTMRNLKKAFSSFLNRVPFYGINIFFGDDPHLRLLTGKLERRKASYGFLPDNDYSVESYVPNSEGTHSVIRNAREKFNLRLQVSGKHNVANALAAVAVADEVGIPRVKTLEALYGFKGVQRRFQLRGKISGVLFVDDYAHHPKEIAATLSAARERFPSSKIRAVFQPHRFSRVADLFDEFVTCFRHIDSVLVTDIYAASEKPLPGIHSSLLAKEISAAGRVAADYEAKPPDAIEKLMKESGPGDVIITLGAGDLPNVYRSLF